MTIDLKKLAKQIEERERFKKANPLFFVTLNTPQKMFMDATTDARPDKVPRRLVFIGANKIGKTTVGVFRGIALATGEHVFLPKDHPLRKIPNWELPTVGLVCAEQLSQAVDKKLVPEYLKWLPKICEVETKKNPQGHVVRITINKNFDGSKLGSIIHFRSWDMKVESFEGIDQHWIHWDEPPKNPHYVAAERGLLPTNGISFMTFTSLKEPWIKDLADESIDYGGPDAGVRIVEAGDIWQNSTENGGFLTPNAIDEFVKIVPKEEVPARVHGKWLQSGSLIYSSFRDKAPWVIPAFEVPRHWTRIESIDPHDAKPTKWMFAAVAPQDITINDETAHRIYIVDALNLPSHLTITEMVEEVQRRRMELGYTEKQLDCILLDAKYGRARTVTLTGEEPPNWQERLEVAGAGYIQLSESKPGSVEVGHKLVRDYLRPQFYKLLDIEVPGIVYFDVCAGLEGPIMAMRRYRYKQGMDKPEEDFKDWMDCLRYIGLYMPRYIDRSSSGGHRAYQARDGFVGR